MNKKIFVFTTLAVVAVLLWFGVMKFSGDVDVRTSPAPEKTIDIAERATFVNSIGIRMVRIPSGSFEMGSPNNEVLRDEDESPVRKITIPEPFYMSAYEISEEDFLELYYERTYCEHIKKKSVNLSWNKARDFCRELTIQETELKGLAESAIYSLPTEAQWEYACRAGTKTPYFWGKDWDDDYGWCKGNSGNKVQPIGVKKPNPWGLFDMSGNLYELCLSNYEKYDEKDNSGRSTEISKDGGIVVRGGSWRREPKTCRSANRGNLSTDELRDDVGFRVVIVRDPYLKVESHEPLTNVVLPLPPIPEDGEFDFGVPYYQPKSAFPNQYRLRPFRQVSSSKFGGSESSEDAVNSGLRWLADNQETDGHWDAKKWGGHGPYDPGITGLVLLAFVGAGNTEKTGKYRRVVQKAIEWLAKNQDTSGNFAPAQTMYSHAIPTLALLEASAMSPVPRTKAIAKRGLDYMLGAQNNYKAWRYWPKDNENDTSVTTWCVMALKAAKIAKFDVPQGAWDGVSKFLDELTETSYGQVGYTSRPIKGAVEHAYQEYSMTACGVLCRLYLGYPKRARLIKLGVSIIEENLPEWNQPGTNAPFYYYWYFASLTMFQIDGASWKSWNEKMRPMLVQHQINDAGQLEGSWDPPANHYGKMGGRVYSTAMAVLTLQVYYRYTRIE